MSPIVNRIANSGSGNFSFGRRRGLGRSLPLPILAYSLTTQQNFNSSNYYDFDLTSNPNDLSKAVTVMMWANVSGSQSEGFGNQSGTLWNWNPGGLGYSGPGMGITKPSYGNNYYWSGAPNDNGLNVTVQGGTWVHMVWQRNSNNQIRGWLNGNALCNYTTTGDSATLSSLNYPHRLGYSIGGYTYSINASITDMFIYKNECYFADTISVPSRGGGAPF